MERVREKERERAREREREWRERGEREGEKERRGQREGERKREGDKGREIDCKKEGKEKGNKQAFPSGVSAQPKTPLVFVRHFLVAKQTNRLKKTLQTTCVMFPSLLCKRRTFVYQSCYHLHS